MRYYCYSNVSSALKCGHFFQTSQQYFLHKVLLYSLCLVPFNCTNTLISKNIKIFWGVNLNSWCHLFLASYLECCIFKLATLHVRTKNIRFLSRDVALNSPFHYQTVSTSRWESAAFKEDERSLLWKADWP